MPLITTENEARLIATFGGIAELNAELNMVKRDPDWAASIRNEIENAIGSSPTSLRSIEDDPDQRRYRMRSASSPLPKLSPPSASRPAQQSPVLSSNATQHSSTRKVALKSDRVIVYVDDQAIRFEVCRLREDSARLFVVRGVDEPKGDVDWDDADWRGSLFMGFFPHQLGLVLSALSGQLDRLSISGTLDGEWILFESNLRTCAGIQVTLGKRDRRIVTSVCHRTILQVIDVVERAGVDLLDGEQLPLQTKLARQAELYIRHESRRAALGPKTG